MAYTKHGAVAVALLGSLAANSGRADPVAADSALAAGIAAAPPQDITLYLEVSIDGETTRTVVPFHQDNGRLLVDPEDLQALGFDKERLKDLPPAKAIMLDQAAERPARAVALDRIPGLHYQYDANRQTIDLRYDSDLKAPHSIGGRPPPAPAAAADTGLVLNYDAFLQGSPDHSAPVTLSVSNEERLFSRLGILDNTGVGYAGGGHDPYVRLDSLWHLDDPAQLTTVQGGDAISSSLSWSRAVRLGGFQYRRNFALRPDLVTFPMPTLSGSAAVPSAVDVYINNVRQFSGDVPSGPFVINNPVALTGAGEARVVVRDDLGREVSTTLPLYVDSRMLGAGLSSFSVESGFLRRNYGLQSFDYDGTPAASASWRYGWSDWLTFEAHGEDSAGLYNAGGGGLLRLGLWGVINAAAGGSAGATNGGQASLGYQLIRPHFSLVLNTTRNYGGYRDLASIDGTPPPPVFDQANVSVPLGRTQNLGLSYIHTDNPTLVPAGAVGYAGGESRIASLSYSAQLVRWCSLFVNGYQELDSDHSLGFWTGLSIDFGQRVIGFVNGGRNQGQDTYGASLSKTADYNGGWQWGLQDNEGSTGFQRLARAGYLGRYGEVDAAAQDYQGQSLLSLEASGGLVFMDGVFEPSRRIYDSFALVSTDGIAGIPVLNENRAIGATDDSGHLLIPDLNSYQHNHLEIDSMVLPVDASIPVTRVDLTPRTQAGVLARFVVQRYTAATVILVDAAGQPLPAGTMLRHTESASDFIVGYDGQAFIEHLDTHNHLVAHNDDPHQAVNCAAQFDYRPPQDHNSLPVIGPVICASKRSGKQ